MIFSCRKAVGLVRLLIGLLHKNQTFPDTINKIRLELAADTNPLTGLPGKVFLERELLKRIAERLPFSIVYISLPQKEYKEKYGLSGGNHIVLFTSKLLANIIKKYGEEKDFLAHIKGDNFIAVIEKERVDAFCEHTVKYFDNLIMSLVEQEKQNKGKSKSLVYSQEYFPFISMFIIDCGIGEKTNLKIISKKVEQLKYRSKPVHGSVCVREQSE